jgi:hypothetical protein
MPISIARFVLAGGRSTPDAAAASARLGLRLDCEVARAVAALPVDMALLSTIGCGSAAAAEAPRCAAAAPEPVRGRRRRVWRSSPRAGLSAATVSPLAASFACLLICCLAIAVFPPGPHRATRDACTTASPALGARRAATQQGPSTVNSNASFAREVERNLHWRSDFSAASQLIGAQQLGAASRYVNLAKACGQQRRRSRHPGIGANWPWQSVARRRRFQKTDALVGWASAIQSNADKASVIRKVSA